MSVSSYNIQRMTFLVEAYCVRCQVRIETSRTRRLTIFFKRIPKFIYLLIKIFKSVHHHIIQINQRARCKNFSNLLLDFIYSSACFGHSHAHRQKLNNCSNSLWFCRLSVVVAVLLVVVGPAGPTTTNSTAITTLRRQNQRLLLQLLSS